MKNAHARLVSLSVVMVAAALLVGVRDDIAPLIGAVLFLLCFVLYVVEYIGSRSAD